MDFEAFQILLGYFTGLRFLDETLTFSTLLGTAFLIHSLDGIACGFIAKKNARPVNLWIIGGLAFGLWALVALLFLVTQRDNNKAGTD